MSSSGAAAESRRNRLLRRVDWRFLAPVEPGGRVVCFAGGPLAEALDLVADELVDPAGATDCDIAVARGPGRRALREAFAALRPGGALYVEFRRPLVGGAALAHRRLHAEGFTDVACYWPWAVGRRTPSYWLPLDSAAAIRYLLTPRRGRAALLGVARIAARAGIVTPICVVARRPAAEEGGGVLARIRSGWEDWGLGPVPARLTAALLTGGAAAINKVGVVVFADDTVQPALLVKLARVPESGHGLEREAAGLRAVEASRRDVRGIPRVIFFEPRGDRAALGETVHPGTPVSSHLRPATLRPVALAVTDLLADLAGKPPPVARRAWWDRLVEPQLAFLGSGEAVSADEIAATQRILAGLGDLPIVCEQRDCSPWNVHVGHDGGLVLLDWESSEPHGLPLCDLVYFVAHAAFSVDGAMRSDRLEESYARLLDPGMPSGAVLAECVSRYAGRIGLHPGSVAPLRVLTWLIHARVRHELLAGAPEEPSPNRARENYFLRLWRVELRTLMPAHGPD